jgi:hypothetical protein
VPINLSALFSAFCSLDLGEEAVPQNKSVSLNAGFGFSCLGTCGHIKWARSDQLKIGFTGSVLPIRKTVFWEGFFLLSTGMYGQFHIFGKSDIASRFFITGQLGL